MSKVFVLDTQRQPLKPYYPAAIAGYNYTFFIEKDGASPSNQTAKYEFGAAALVGVPAPKM